MKLIGIGATRELSARIAAGLEIELSMPEERDFEDSEFKIRPLESVRGETVFVCQSLAADSDQSANDKLVRLLFLAGALKDAGAGSVVAVTPYLAYARKDRRTKARDPVTIRYLAQMFEAVGIDAVMTADVHNLAAFENAFRCLKEHVEAAPLFVEYFKGRLSDTGPIVVLSPDSGGVKRARAFADGLSAEIDAPVELAFMEKHRSEGEVSGTLFAGEVAGSTVIVIDDLISGGATMARAARACVERGAAGVHAVATHGVFGRDVSANLNIPELSSVVVTDTVGDVSERCTLGEKLVVLPSAPIFAERIRRIGRP